MLSQSKNDTISLSILIIIATIGISAACCTQAVAACFGENAACNISTDGRNFNDSEGHRFFWMGDTAWLFSTSELPCAGQPLCSGGNFGTYINDRHDQGFNVLQGLIFVYPHDAPEGRPAAEDVKANNEGNQSPFCGSSCPGQPRQCGDIPVAQWNYSCPNDAYYANVASRISYMNQKGIVAAIAPSWDTSFDCQAHEGAPGWTTTQITSYYTYLANYFKTYKIVWLAAGNVHQDGPPNCSNLTWSDLATTIRNNDSTHLVTIHPSSTPRAGYDTTQFQHQPCEDPTWTTQYQGSVPAVDGEFNYETVLNCWNQKAGSSNNCASGNFGNACRNFVPDVCVCDANCAQHHHAKPDIVLYAAWSIVMRGGYFTYGNTATYLNFADKGTCIDNRISEGASEMRTIHDFFNNNPYKTVDWNASGFEPKNPPSSTAEDTKLVMGKTGSQYVLYAKTSGTFSALSSLNDSGPWEYRSQDIRTGAWTPALTSPPNPWNGNISSFPSVSADSVTLVNKVVVLKCSPNATVDPNGSVSIFCDLVATGALDDI